MLKQYGMVTAGSIFFNCQKQHSRLGLKFYLLICCGWSLQQLKYNHIWPLQSTTSVRIIGLVFPTNYVVTVYFKHKYSDLQFKIDSEVQIFFEKLFMAIFIYYQSFCQKSAKRKSPRKYFLYFDLSSIGVTNWRRRARSRGDWKDVLRQAEIR